MFLFCFVYVSVCFFFPLSFHKNDEISYQAVEHRRFMLRSAVKGLCSRVTSFSVCIHMSPISLSPGRTNCSVMIQNGHLFHIFFPFWCKLIIYSKDSSQKVLNSKYRQICCWSKKKKVLWCRKIIEVFSGQKCGGNNLSSYTSIQSVKEKHISKGLCFSLLWP